MEFEGLRAVSDQELLARRVVGEVLIGANPDSTRELLAEDVVVHGPGAGIESVGLDALLPAIAGSPPSRTARTR